MQYRIFNILIITFFLSIQSFGQYQKVQSHGLDIYYRIFGQGEPILIIGGGPGDVSDRYLSLCDLLSKHHQCILVDQRGTGKSTPTILDSISINIALTLDDFEAIRNKLGLKQWNVLGFSYGGYLASLYANYFPNSISKLVLLGSAGLNTNVFEYFFDNISSRLWPSDVEQIKYWRDSAQMAKDAHHAITEQIRAMMPGYFYDRDKSFIVSKAIKDSDFNFEMGQWIWKDVEKRNLDLALFTSTFIKPVLILHGRQDPLGESVPQVLSRYYSNFKLVFVEKAGHYSWVEQPETISAAINEFIFKTIQR